MAETPTLYMIVNQTQSQELSSCEYGALQTAKVASHADALLLCMPPEVEI